MLKNRRKYANFNDNYYYIITIIMITSSFSSLYRIKIQSVRVAGTFQVQSQWNNIPNPAQKAIWCRCCHHVKTSKVCESALNTGLVFRFPFSFSFSINSFPNTRARIHTQTYSDSLSYSVFFLRLLSSSCHLRTHFNPESCVH